ncbi:MAG: tetratricopeptide repeat protein [Dechloromonas sp.]|nr:MAG: tetratricopeptide repeat protein [Dechloromonas sp.]
MRALHILALLGSLGVAPRAVALIPSEVFAKAGAGVVVLEVLNEHGQLVAAQSATVVGPEQLVTACNGLEGAAGLQITAHSGSVPVVVTARDRERNLCLLAARGLKAGPLPFATSDLPTGTRVLAISNALTLGVGISEGMISGRRAFPVGSLIQFTAPISPGSEGGALLDEEGRLVAILDYHRRDGQNVNFASPVAWVMEVKARAHAAESHLKLFDRAMLLAKEQKWTDLQALAEDWSKMEADSADPWRFAITAAKALGDQDGEWRGWQEWRRIEPGSSEVAVGFGRVLLGRGLKQEALDLARQLTTGRAVDAASWLFLGQVQQAMGQFAEADQSYRRALDMDPWLIAGYQGLTGLAQARGDSKTAIAVWRRLSGLFGEATWARLGLVQAYLAAGDSRRAWSALTQVAMDDADAPLLWYWKGVVLARLGCSEQAISAYRTSLEKKFEHPDWAWGGIGHVQAEQRAYREAAEAFRFAVEANPDYDEWRYQLAVNLKDSAFGADAFAITTDLVTKHPEMAKYWRQHGFTLATLGRAMEAIPAMERSLQLEPKQGKLWAALVETYQQAGRREDARRAYETLRGIDAELARIAYRNVILPYDEVLP